MKHLIKEIHAGRNLDKNLRQFEKKAVETYRDYASLELTFSAFSLIEEIWEEKSDLSAAEKTVTDEICRVLDTVGRGMGERDGIIRDVERLRKKITEKMDYFTSFTDRLICYEYVLNRMELKYISEKELKKRLAAFDEEQYVRGLCQYLFVQKDQTVIRDKVRLVVGQIPVRMTKSKFFEKISEALTLYKGGDKSSLDNFIYMIRTASMVYEPAYKGGEYTEFHEILEDLENADYSGLSEEEYNRLVKRLEQGAKQVSRLTDFYYSMQKVVNCIYAVALIRNYQTGETKLTAACQSIWVCLAKGEHRDEMLTPLEGRIEENVEKTSYLESVLFEVKASYKKELKEVGLTQFYEDFALVANLLSDSLFIDLDEAASEEKADASYVERCREELFRELEEKMSGVSRPVKRAIMGEVLEKLPMMFEKSGQIEEYIRVNLLGCQDKAEKCTVMTMLWDLVREESEWRLI